MFVGGEQRCLDKEDMESVCGVVSQNIFTCFEERHIQFARTSLRTQPRNSQYMRAGEEKKGALQRAHTQQNAATLVESLWARKEYNQGGHQPTCNQTLPIRREIRRRASASTSIKTSSSTCSNARKSRTATCYSVMPMHEQRIHFQGKECSHLTNTSFPNHPRASKRKREVMLMMMLHFDVLENVSYTRRRVEEERYFIVLACQL